MPQVHHVKKAAKNYKDDDIKKGESYYWWKFRYGSKHRSKVPPKQSQLTQSEFLSTVWGIAENFAELGPEDDLQAAVDEAKGQLEDLGSECTEKRDNMPESLQDSDTGQLLEQRAEECDNMANELDAVNLDNDEEEGSDKWTERQQEILDELTAIEYQGE